MAFNRSLRLWSRQMSSSSSSGGGNIPHTDCRTAIVMMNMGGPQHVDDVYEYLNRIMTDRNMIQFPFLQNFIGNRIAKKRTADVQKKYLEIGGKSPILDWTLRQGQLLCEKLNSGNLSEFAPFKSYVAFRYVKPFAADCFDEIRRDGVKRVILFSQYPQYSCATSGSSFHEIYKHLEANPIDGLDLRIIDRWATNDKFVQVFCNLIANELDQFTADERKNLMILFSAHSLPLKAVQRGDSYPSEVGTTVNLIMDRLKYSIPYQLVWQSRVGPLPWLGPFTDDAICAYVSKGIRNFILVPIAFVNEHIETLHEMDIEYCKDLTQKLDVNKIRRVPAPNDHPVFIEAMANQVTNCLSDTRNVNSKFLSRCPHCDNNNCHLTKSWFSQFVQ